MKLFIIKLLTLLLIIVVISTNNTGTASNLSKNNTAKNIKMLKKADQAFQEMKFAIAAEYYESYIKNTTNTTSGILKNMAECYWQMRELTEALRVYAMLYPTKKDDIDPIIQKRIAELYARNDEYAKASAWLQQLSGYEQKAETFASEAKLRLLKNDSLRWKSFLLDINTDYREFAPLLHKNTLYFSSNKLPVGTIKSYGWDGDNYTRLWKIPVMKIDSSHTVKAINSTSQSATKKTIRLADIYENGDNKSTINKARVLIREPYLTYDSVQHGTLVNGLQQLNLNAGTIAIDQNSHIFLSANYSKANKTGINRIRLLEGKISDNSVYDIKPLPFGDANGFSAMHPAVNKDGTILVFSSDKPNGRGGYDLYYSQRTAAQNQWSSPVILNQKINTVGNEVFPCISGNEILYFSSDQMPGLGGLDIYRIPLADAINATGIPEHISYPINSGADDFGMTLDSTETSGFFASDRLDNNDNLYGFYVIPQKPGRNYLGGIVSDKQTLTPIKGATVFIWDKLNDSVMVAKTDENGQFKVLLTNSGDYVVKAIEKNYTYDCLTVSSLDKQPKKDTIQSIPRSLLLNKLEVDLVIRLNNIHYDFDKWFIRADARPILDSLVTVLNRYPIKVELSSHTDSRGSFAYNDRLSQHRAEAAVEYLIKSGISPERITAKGYGERQLLNKCADGVKCTVKEHQANRRTEVKITGLTTEGRNPEIDPDKFIDGQKLNKSELPNSFFDKCK